MFELGYDKEDSKHVEIKFALLSQLCEVFRRIILKGYQSVVDGLRMMLNVCDIIVPIQLTSSIQYLN